MGDAAPARAGAACRHDDDGARDEIAEPLEARRQEHRHEADEVSGGERIGSAQQVAERGGPPPDRTTVLGEDTEAGDALSW
jgi:hypothetical protein